MNAFTEHYTKLFEQRQPPKGGFPQLNNKTTETLQLQISPGETEQAIDKLNDKKLPEPNGLNARFYKMFKTELSGLLQVVFESSLWTGILPPSFYQAHKVLSLKSKEVAQLTKVMGYRPITLLNIDYKVLVQALAK